MALMTNLKTTTFDEGGDEPQDGFAVERILQRAGRHHFAFLKAYLEGLDIREMAKRYLENAVSPKVSMKETLLTLQWIRKDLSTLAKRHGQYAFARVINLNPDQIKTQPSVGIPSLDAFREDHDPDEMYSEEELIELFQEKFGAVTAEPKQERNLRLLKKQTDALRWLENLVAVDPVLADGVDAWMVPSIANRLKDAHILTIGELLDRINGRGNKWHNGIVQLGEVNAARIVKWLKFYEVVIGEEVGIQALVKRSELNLAQVKSDRKPEHDIVPFEYFLPRSDLDGSCGENRGVRNKSGVENDYDAIHLWLKQQENFNTYRSYRKEAERFLLWALLERGKPFSSLLTIDCLAYRDFLRDLGKLDADEWRSKYKIPMERWIGRRGTERWSSLWRPFEKPPVKKVLKTDDVDLQQYLKKSNDNKKEILSPSSQKLSHTILKSLCDYLMRQRYLDSNPFDGVKAPTKGLRKMNVGHSFTMKQWEFITEHLDTFERDAHYYRLKFILCFAYETGMRISEMVNAKLGDIEEAFLADTSDYGRTIKVLGKGDVHRDVVITDIVFTELNNYLAHRGLGSFDQSPKDRPLIDVLVGTKFPNPHAPKEKSELGIHTQKVKELRQPTDTISINRMHEILKEFFYSAASAMLPFSITDARHIEKASTHWLRHTCGSHAAANGTPVAILRDNFGHASLETTSQYITTERDNRIRAMELHSKKMLEKAAIKKSQN